MVEKRKIVVSGATGFVAQYLIPKLFLNGYEITLLVRDPLKASKMFLLPVEIVKWDALKKEPPLAAIEGAYAIIHLLGAGIADGRWTKARKRLLIDSRIKSTKNILSAIKKVKEVPKVFVGASAIGYYGDRGDEVLDECSSVGSGFLAKLCQSWEQEVSKVESLACRRVSLRTGVVLGEGGGALSKMLLPFRMGMGGPVGSGKQYMSWIHVQDLVSLIIFSLNNQELQGALNATALTPVTNREFTNTLASVLRRPAFVPLPISMLRLIFGKMSEVLLSSQRALPQKAVSLGFKFKYRDLVSALREILLSTGVSRRKLDRAVLLK